ncbi:70113c77-6f9d-4deb-b272-97f6b8084596-CDS [Sclerotinia trifoliorum]|uniref:70113c77-6f9d-4deb-b272-97f6b8084596-CDS n=1 Tax=Sclerotinia trifoliorum TaxID=28548 RepID=A0A8H2W6G6_9HELO|nr:70113c77-6f9d-4deb-b272-97f6b8084596-CDS [Sclerotinia trifoliorum]
MCISICHTHTCPHISYINHPCEPNAYAPTCPYRKEEQRNLDRMCGRCLIKQGIHLDKDRLQKAKERRRTEAAEIREGTILTLKRLEQANELVEEEKKESRQRRRRHTTGGMGDIGKGDKTRKCVNM